MEIFRNQSSLNPKRMLPAIPISDQKSRSIQHFQDIDRWNGMDVKDNNRNRNLNMHVISQKMKKKENVTLSQVRKL